MIVTILKIIFFALGISLLLPVLALIGALVPYAIVGLVAVFVLGAAWADWKHGDNTEDE